MQWFIRLNSQTLGIVSSAPCFGSWGFYPRKWWTLGGFQQSYSRYPRLNQLRCGKPLVALGESTNRWFFHIYVGLPKGIIGNGHEWTNEDRNLCFLQRKMRTPWGYSWIYILSGNMHIITISLRRHWNGLIRLVRASKLNYDRSRDRMKANIWWILMT